MLSKALAMASIESGGSARLGAAQRGFDFAPHFFNGIEVRRVGRQEEDHGSEASDQRKSWFTFVRGEIVHDDDITLAQGWTQNTAHIGPENLGIGGPSIVMQAGEPSKRIEQIMVVVCQWPWGLLAWTRFPRGARPRRRVRLVFAPDSSRKINRAGSKPSWRRRHARRARAMSARSCSLARSVFFYLSAPSSPAHSGWLGVSIPAPRRHAALSR
jgi:hypothetical protein